MDLRQLTPDLAVTAQIEPQDVAQLAKAGFRVLINNRPDDELPPELQSSVMAEAARAAGIAYHYLPFTPGQITPDLISGYGQALAEGQPTVAYCRSGNRSTVLWALNQAGKLSEEQILKTAGEAGYDLTPVLPMIRSLSRRAP